MVKEIKLVDQVTVENVTKKVKNRLLKGKDDSKTYIFVEEYNLDSFADNYHTITLKLYEII